MRTVPAAPVQLSIIIILTIIIHATETLTYGIRLGGIRLKKIAVALSLTGIVLLIARTSNMFQAPIIGVIVDRAKADPTIDVLAIFHIILSKNSVKPLALDMVI
jgi:hypothetical protein